MIKNFKDFLNESFEDLVKPLEELILSLELSSFQLADSLLVGSPELFPLIFNGELKKLCESLGESFNSLFVVNYESKNPKFNLLGIKGLGEGFGWLKFYNTKIEYLPLGFIRRLKEKYKKTQLIMYFEKCVVNLYGKITIPDLNVSFMNSDVVSGTFLANTIYMEGKSSNILKWVNAIDKIEFYNCQDLTDLKMLVGKKFKELSVWGCNNFKSFEGCPKIEILEFFGNDKINSLKGIDPNIKELVLSHIDFVDLKGFPKNIDIVRQFKLTFNGAFLRKSTLRANGINVKVFEDL